MTLHFDDIAPGDEFVSVGRTVTEADIMAFAGVSGDFNLLHTNDPWARANTPFKGRVAHGLLVLSMSSGLPTPGFDDLKVLAYLNVERRMAGPTYPGDTIHAVHRVEQVRPSASRPEAGVITVVVEVRNERDEVVQMGTDVVLVARGTPST
jgi:acyl dehydratase